MTSQVILKEGAAPGSPGTDKHALYVDSADSKFKIKDDAGAVSIQATEASVTTIAQGLIDTAIDGLLISTYPSVTSHTLNVSANRTAGSGDEHYSATYQGANREMFNITYYLSSSNSSSADVKLQVSDDGTTGWTDIVSYGIINSEIITYNAKTVVLYPDKYYRAYAGVGAYTADCSVTVDLICTL